MTAFKYSGIAQWNVLKEVNIQCGIDNVNPKQIEVDGVSSKEISTYVHLLSELGFVKSRSYQDPNVGETYFPISITAKGLECLSQTDKQFWENALDAATEGVKALTGVDLEKFIVFFRETYHKYRRERD